MPLVSVGADTLNYTHNGVEPGGDKVPMVLIHGAGGQCLDWPATWRSGREKTRLLGLSDKAHARQLAAFPVYALDLPGHGKSGGESHDAVEAYADAVGSFLEALDLRRVLLVGHSMGAAIALDLAVRQNPRVAGIALIGSSSRLPVSEAILQGLQSDFEATVDSIVKYSWFKSTGAFFKQLSRKRMLEAGQAATSNDFLACSRFNLTDRLGDVSVPALIVASDSDRMVPADRSRKMADAIVDSTFVEMRDCGHFLHVENDSEVAGALTTFVTNRLTAA